LPRPVDYYDYELIADRFYSRVSLDPDCVTHLIGIANGGDPIAVAIGMMHQQYGLPLPCFHTSFNPRRHANVIDYRSFLGSCGVQHILIDNSIRTGGTVVETLERLRASHGILPKYVVKLINYDDKQEVEVASFLETVFAINLVSLYDIAEVRRSAHRNVFDGRFRPPQLDVL